MTNKEMLAELKQSCEYLLDIQNNNEDRLNNDDLIKIDNICDELNYLYMKTYNVAKQDKDNLKIKNVENVEISDNIYADYNDLEDEKNIITCGDLNYYWYQDDKFLDR